jgi:hypothetical protein
MSFTILFKLLTYFKYANDSFELQKLITNDIFSSSDNAIESC